MVGTRAGGGLTLVRGRPTTPRNESTTPHAPNTQKRQCVPRKVASRTHERRRHHMVACPGSCWWGHRPMESECVGRGGSGWLRMKHGRSALDTHVFVQSSLTRLCPPPTYHLDRKRTPFLFLPVVCRPPPAAASSRRKDGELHDRPAPGYDGPEAQHP